MKRFFIVARVAVVVVTAIFVGCSGEERVINTLPDAWQLLCVSSGMPATLALQEYPDNKSVSADMFMQANNMELPAAVSNVQEFRDKLYLLMPSAKKIYAIDSKTFLLKDSIDFSAENHIPAAICFANATTAYVSHENDTTVSVVDITAFKIARTIAVGKKPVGIAAVGNQVFVANQASNTVTQIDTRTNLVVAQHQTPPAPTFAQPSTDGKSILIICLGAGKIDNSVPKTDAYAVFIDAPTARITQQVALHDAYYGSDAAAKPRGLAVTQADWAFIPTDIGLFQIDLINKGQPYLINETAYDIACYNYRRAELLLTLNGDIIVADPNTGKEKNKYSMPVATAAAVLGR
ncbi:hypothetical protein MASR2M18_10250 [Ignavibacteria bacterium]|nr:hypothetical protein [Bacteroidota bacterium]MCZ2133225.1 hypothetical protein [Bacteroidota bacterium]